MVNLAIQRTNRFQVFVPSSRCRVHHSTPAQERMESGKFLFRSRHHWTSEATQDAPRLTRAEATLHGPLTSQADAERVCRHLWQRQLTQRQDDAIRSI